MINVSDINWIQYSGVEYYFPDEVANALIKLQDIPSNVEWHTVYNIVLSAVGNNHAGTYYPAILSALPIVIDVIENSDNELSRLCALEILTDWHFSFYLDNVGAYTQHSAAEIENFVKQTIHTFIAFIPYDLSHEGERIRELLQDLKEDS